MSQSGNRLKRLCRCLPSLLPPLAATVLILIQQIYYPRAQAEVLVNVFLLFLNLLNFILFVCRRGLGKVLDAAGIIFVAILAILYNIQVRGCSTPLSDFKSFLDSACGLWLAVLAMEIIGYQFMKNRNEKVRDQLQWEASLHDTRMTHDHEKDIETYGTNANIRNNETYGNDPGNSSCSFGESRKKTQGMSSAKKVLIIYIGAMICIPFANWSDFAGSGWMASVRAIASFIFNKNLNADENAIALLLYLLAQFAIVVAILTMWKIALYVLNNYFSDDYTKPNFFEEYGTPIIILVAAGAFILTVRNIQDGTTEMIEFASNMFVQVLGIIVVLIALLVAFEIIRLIIKQCLNHGSLLKTSMHLIFVVIVEYAVGLLMGILRIFALRDVIESLLLMFLPDLDNSIESMANRVLNAALEREIRYVEKEMKQRKTRWKQQKNRKSKYRTVLKRRHRK